MPRTVLANNISEEDLRVLVINRHKSVPDNAGNSEQVEIPVGLYWIKNQYYNFKIEVGFIAQIIMKCKWENSHVLAGEGVKF